MLDNLYSAVISTGISSVKQNIKVQFEHEELKQKGRNISKIKGPGNNSLITYH